MTSSSIVKRGIGEQQEEKKITLDAKRGKRMKKGLIPYTPNVDVCARCGGREPKMFNVPDREWQKYVVPEYQNEVLCRPCYDHYKRIFPQGWRAGKKVTVKRAKHEGRSPTQTIKGVQ